MIDMNLMQLWHDMIGHNVKVVDSDKIPTPEPPAKQYPKSAVSPHEYCCTQHDIAPAMSFQTTGFTDDGSVWQKNQMVYFPDVSALNQFLTGFQAYYKAMMDHVEKIGKQDQFYPPKWFANDPYMVEKICENMTNTIGIKRDLLYLHGIASGWWTNSGVKSIESWIDVPQSKGFSFKTKSHPVLAGSWASRCRVVGDDHVKIKKFDHTFFWPDNKWGGNMTVSFFLWCDAQTSPGDLEGAAPHFIGSGIKWGNQDAAMAKMNNHGKYNGKDLTTVYLDIDYDHANCLICAQTDYVQDTGYIMSQLQDLTQ